MSSRACSFKTGKAGSASGCAVDRGPLSPISRAPGTPPTRIASPSHLLAGACDWLLAAGWLLAVKYVLQVSSGCQDWHGEHCADALSWTDIILTLLLTHTQHTRSLGYGRIDPSGAMCARPRLGLAPRENPATADWKMQLVRGTKKEPTALVVAQRLQAQAQALGPPDRS